MNAILTSFKVAFGLFGGLIVFWLGGLDQLLTVLIVLMVLDYITGIASAWYRKALSSEVGFRGIAKKVMLLCVVALAFAIEHATNGAFPLREITIMFFVANEALSIVENAAEIGLPIPKKLKAVLEQLKGDSDDPDGKGQ